MTTRDCQTARPFRPCFDRSYFGLAFGLALRVNFPRWKIVLAPKMRRDDRVDNCHSLRPVYDARMNSRSGRPGNWMGLIQQHCTHRMSTSLAQRRKSNLSHHVGHCQEDNSTIYDTRGNLSWSTFAGLRYEVEGQQLDPSRRSPENGRASTGGLVPPLEFTQPKRVQSRWAGIGKLDRNTVEIIE
ncbi:hypothetical protein BDN72DRAFT_5727 [Pluteus cervinus]|uniref:Uncharacterized protein n=1 Tax=Pluteus cervinus TaxID=181527 RepID=A0ACD3BFS3_9AGAR|nr:hypothetical protein BDN72DRAFT_5727 [Pluteus cervinus]